MSRDKQIEEIKSLNLLLEDITVDKVLYTSDGEVVSTFKVPAVELKVTNYLANILYSKGYRKASDVAREIFEEIENKILANTSDISGCKHRVFAELKKKYTGREKEK